MEIDKTIEVVKRMLTVLDENIKMEKVVISNNQYIDIHKTVELVLLDRYMNKRCIYCGKKADGYDIINGIHYCGND